MFTRFEEYAATSMLGGPESPPRRNGKLQFSSPWERDVFGIALALAKAGYFEWDDLRQCLIEAVQSGRPQTASSGLHGITTSDFSKRC